MRLVYWVLFSCFIEICYIFDCLIVLKFEGIPPKWPYLPCLSMAGRALLAGYHWYMQNYFTGTGAMMEQPSASNAPLKNWSMQMVYIYHELQIKPQQHTGNPMDFTAKTNTRFTQNSFKLFWYTLFSLFAATWHIICQDAKIWYLPGAYKKAIISLSQIIRSEFCLICKILDFVLYKPIMLEN